MELYLSSVSQDERQRLFVPSSNGFAAFGHSLYVKINLMSYVLAIIHLLDRQRTLHYIHHLRISYPILRISYIQCHIL